MRCSFTGASGVTMKMSAVPNGRPSANGAGSPPGAIIRSLLYVSRTKPQVAFGSSLSRLLISSAVTVSGIGLAGLTSGCGSGSEAPPCASDGASVAAPASVARLRKLRRPNRLRFGRLS